MTPSSLSDGQTELRLAGTERVAFTGTTSISMGPAGKYTVTARSTWTPRDKGIAGQEDAAKHLRDHAPAFVLAALGDMLLAHRGREFTSDDVFMAACDYSLATRDWFSLAGRDKCYGGWWMTHAKLHHLERTGAQRRSVRPSRRGAWLPVWRFPTEAR